MQCLNFVVCLCLNVLVVLHCVMFDKISCYVEGDFDIDCKCRLVLMRG